MILSTCLLLAPALQGQSLLHPAEAVLYLEVPDFQAAASAYADSAWSKVLNDPDLDEWFAGFIESDGIETKRVLTNLWRNAEAEGELPSISPHLGTLRSISLSLSLADNSLAAYLSGVPKAGAKASNGWIGNCRLVAVAEFASEEAAKAAQEDWSRASGQQRKGSAKTKRGASFLLSGTRLMVAHGELLGAPLQGLAEGTGPSLVERRGALGEALDQTGEVAASEERGTTIVEVHHGAGDGLLTFLESRGAPWAGFAGLVQMSGLAFGPALPELTRGGAWRVRFVDGEFRTSGRFAHRAGAPGQESIGLQPLTESDLALIHPDAVCASAVTVDAAALQAQLTRMMDSKADRAELKRYAEDYGFDPIGDIAGSIGSAISWSLVGDIGPRTPHYQMVAAVTDAEAMRRGVAGLVRWIQETEPGDVQVQTQEFEGVELVTLTGENLPTNYGGISFDPRQLLQPTIAVLDDRVLLAMTREQAKLEVKRALAGQNTRHPKLAEGSSLRAPGGSGVVAFGSWAKVWSQAAAAVAVVSAEGESGVEDLLLLLEGMPNHFRGSSATYRRGKDHTRYEGRSPFGPETPYATAVIGSIVQGFVLESLGSAKLGKAKADVMMLNSACTQYAINNGGRYPKSLEDLVAPDKNGRRFIAGETLPPDPWGNAYRMKESRKSGLSIWSCGPDGKDNKGKGDDIESGRLIRGD